jgi:hypothetical protein
MTWTRTIIPGVAFLFIAAVNAPRLFAQASASVPADVVQVPPELVTPARIDPSLAAESIRARTLVRIWQQDGQLLAARRILADPVKQAQAVGHLAEEDFVVRNPAWRKTAAANAPENDVWRWFRGRLEGGQIKTHADGDPLKYMRDMRTDTKAEQFLVPDDHIDALMAKIRRRIEIADLGANDAEASFWREQIKRATRLGRTYSELKGAVVRFGQITVRSAALKAAGAGFLLTVAVDGSIVAYRSANGELTPLQTEAAGAEALTKGALVGGATYIAVVAGANPIGITVIVVGGVVYIAADYAISELRPAYGSSPMTPADIEQVLPVGWREADALHRKLEEAW